MWDGIQRRVRNTAHVMGFRISYAVASGVYSLQLAAEQVGSHVANNIDLVLAARGTGVVRTAGTLRGGNLSTSNGVLASTNNAMVISTTDGTIANMDAGPGAIRFYKSLRMSLASATISGDGPSAAFGFAPLTVKGADCGNGQDGLTGLTLHGGNASTNATVNIIGGHVKITGGNGAASSAGAAHGGNVRIAGGTKFGTGTTGVVELGFDGTLTSRVTVRNTIFALNGYTTTAAAATTTELPTAGDFGIHKNSSSGAVHLCFNDGGTIKSVQLT